MTSTIDASPDDIPLQDSAPQEHVAASIQLPVLSQFDNSSFVNLIDHFASAGQIDASNHSTGAMDFAWNSSQVSIVPTSHTIRSDGHTSSTRHALPARNDSTGSSSAASTCPTTSTATITRNSSYSSVESNKTPTPPPKDSNNHGVTALPTIEPNAAVLESPGSIKQTRRANTHDSITSRRSATPDLYKPLPSRPAPARSDVSKAVATSLEEWGSCLPTRPVLRQTHSAQRRAMSMTIARHPGISSGTAPIPLAAQMHSRPRSRSVTVFELPGSTPTLAPQPLSPQRSRTQATIANHQITAYTAERVIYKILCNLRRPEDLRNAVMVSKGFLNTFLRNESKIVSRMMFKSCKPAWETRRSVILLRSSTAFRICDYLRDLRTIKALKAKILMHCKTMCRSRTVEGLSGLNAEAATEVDDALWRLWTFCALFGDNAHRKEVPAAQLEWLAGSSSLLGQSTSAGFGVGNDTGLTPQQLDNMAEMWQCLKSMLSRFNERIDQAKEAGIFDEWNPADGISQRAHLQEWTSYLLTLGPQVILAVSSTSFEKAQALGLTRWPAPPSGHSRNAFIDAALSEALERASKALPSRPAMSAPVRKPRHRPSRSVDETRPADAMRRHALRIDTQVIRPRPLSTMLPRSTTITIRPDCDPESAAAQLQRSNPLFPASPTNDPTFFHTLITNRSASTRLGATLFPVDYLTSSRPQVPFLPSSKAPQPSDRRKQAAQVIDPVDKALDLLVHEMGFPEANAKRALAMSDTGSGIDVQKAVDILSVEKPRAINTTPIELPTPADIVAPFPRLPSTSTTPAPDRCNGSCRRHFSQHLPHSSTVSRKHTHSHKHTRSKSLSHDPFPSTTQIPHPFPLSNPNSHSASNTPTPISPLTDIYGGHSSIGSSTTSVDHHSGDIISPLTQHPLSIHPSLQPAPSGGKDKNASARKAWRVLGVPTATPTHDTSRDGRKTAAAAAAAAATLATRVGHSKGKRNVVAMDEYLARVERRQSSRATQRGWQAQAPSEGRVFGVPTAAGLGRVEEDGVLRGSGGLGGLRAVTVGEGAARQSLREAGVEETRGKSEGVWRSVVGTVRRERGRLGLGMGLGVGKGGGGGGKEKEKEVAREMCVGAGERRFVG